ncbi:DPP IV N-terminal domain-containing protein [candidate division KSB1 bacterium]
MKKRIVSASVIMLLVGVLSCGYQQYGSVEKIDEALYARAESFLSANTNPLVTGTMSNSAWMTDGRLQYRKTVPGGHEFVLVDPEKQVKTSLFDHSRLAEALSEATGTTFDANNLPLSQFEFSDDDRTLTFESGGKKYSCNMQSYQITEQGEVQQNRNSIVSPDENRAAFIRDYNLWVRDLATGRETRLTSDGVKDFGYATNNAGWTKSDRPVLLWSPDSKKIATFQHDGRGVGEMYLVSTKVGHPELQAWKGPLPGDDNIFMLHRVVIHIDNNRVVRLQMPPDPHRSTISDHVAGRNGSWLDVEWSADSAQLAFVSSSRDHKQARLFVADPETGKVQEVMEETVDTFFESGNGRVNWHILPESNEAIWFSERDNWGHLYLYDLSSGQLKHQITRGEWNVLQLLHIDKENRTLYFTGAGREDGDPYFQYLYSIGMDDNNLKCLTPENANHAISLNPSVSYFTDTYSTPEVPPVSVMRDKDGGTVVALEEADISRLVDMGWQPPIPIKVKARDSQTDIYGLMYRPTHFDPSKSYPILNYLYPGPQSGSVGSRSFRASRSEKQSLAELGFIVVEVDAMGTPGRSKSFHTAYYGNMGDNGLPDQIAAIKELASKNKWMDLDKVGIWGHSGGGFASTDAILRYPDFYKVAVSGAGNHDNRNYEDDWGEKWQGLLVTNPDGTTNYDNQANQLLAANLKGKLLLAHGTMDSNVPPSNTMLVVNALIEANKDFDLIMFPNRGHGFGSEPYMMRRRWDYFVRHLLGAEPPKEYKFISETGRR